jgi:hypothetical protein
MHNESLLDHLLEIPSCALIATGRTGTDFLQSLFDSHPEVLTFNGTLFFYSFWDNSVCVKAKNFNTNDLLQEFIGKHIELLKSRYDLMERKNQLGETFDQSLDIDLIQFKKNASQILQNRELNPKNILLAIYASYAICLGQDIRKKRLFFHHAHHFDALDPFLKDFPNSKVICMTRDPRANFVSLIEKWRPYSPTDNERHLYYCAKRIYNDTTIMKKYNNEYIAIRVEDLNRGCIFEKLCNWLDIAYNDCLKKSTWGGLLWLGDSLTSKNLSGGRSRDILKNKWEEKLSFADKLIFNFILNKRLKHYNYSYEKISFVDPILVLFFILLPLSHETRFFSINYIKDSLKKKEYQKTLKNIIFYFLRVFLFLKYYFNAIKKSGFSQPFLQCDD